MREGMSVIAGCKMTLLVHGRGSCTRDGLAPQVDHARRRTACQVGSCCWRHAFHSKVAYGQ